MTAAQESAIKRIMEISREHFEASVFVAIGDPDVDEAKAEGKDPDKCADHQYVYHGGAAASLGLLEMAKLHIWKRGVEESDPCR